MPITRLRRRELDGNLCRLRSGKRLQPRPAAKSSISRSNRDKQSNSQVSANPDLITEKTALEEPQQGGDQGSQDMPAPSSASTMISTQPLAIGVNDDEQRENPASLHEGTHLQEFLPESEGGTFAKIDSAEHDPQATSGGIASEGVSHTRQVEDIGIPTDQKWDCVAAHKRRFCFDHGEKEWLLEYSDRWMSPGDFPSGAEVKLEKMLRDYQSNAFTSKSHKRASPAECNSSLWSEVDTAVQHDDAGNKYLIRWKWRWTPESDIDDPNWANASYEAQNEMLKRRCSGRKENTAEVVASRERMMNVFGLENLLVEE